LGDLVDRLHRTHCGLAPRGVSRHAANSGDHPRIPILSIDDMGSPKRLVLHLMRGCDVSPV
jgi:hypothetical protein